MSRGWLTTLCFSLQLFFKRFKDSWSDLIFLCQSALHFSCYTDVGGNPSSHLPYQRRFFDREHPCPGRISFQIQKQSSGEKGRASKNINKVGDARGLCEEQMASGCKHTSTFISREARWGDVLFSLLTIYCLLKIFPLCLSVRFACVFLQFWIFFFLGGGVTWLEAQDKKKPKTATTKHKQIWSTVDDVHFSNFFFFWQCVNYRNKVPSFVVSSWAYSGPSL